MKKDDKTHLAVLVGAFVVLGGLYAVSRDRGSGFTPAAQASFGDIALSPVGAPERKTELKSCPTGRCLNIYLSPWCGVCRASTDLIKALRPWLAARGVASRVIIGRDRQAEVEEYAKVFGPETLMDASGQVPLKGGVPHFLISDAEGNILRTQPGILRIVRPPIPEAELQALADALDLL